MVFILSRALILGWIFAPQWNLFLCILVHDTRSLGLAP